MGKIFLQMDAFYLILLIFVRAHGCMLLIMANERKWKKTQNVFYDMFFYLVTWKKRRIFVPLSWKQSFYLKKKLIPIENLKRGLCEKTPFLFAA